MQTILIDSRDRDRSVWPSPGSFTINLDQGVKGAMTLRVHGAIIPNVALGAAYLSLIIKGIPRLTTGSNHILQEATVILVPDTAHGSTHYRAASMSSNCISFASGASFRRLEVSLLDPQGAVIDLGIDAVLPSDPTDSMQWLLNIEITY